MNFKLCHFKSSDNNCTDNIGFQVAFCVSDLFFCSCLSPFPVSSSSLPSCLSNSFFLLSLILDQEPFQCSAKIRGRSDGFNSLRAALLPRWELQPQKKQSETNTITMLLGRESPQRKLRLPGILCKHLDIKNFL